MAADVWIVDSGPGGAMGVGLPVRMTVLRLPDGGLLLHSPTRFTAELKRQLEQLGPIRFLVAPSFAHWVFLREWQRQCPQVSTLAAPGLRQRRQVRKAGVAIDGELAGPPPATWGDAIAMLTVPGAGGFHEVALFHKPTRTLVLTDLVLNLEPAKLPSRLRLFSRLVGTTAPDGRAPVYLRAIVRLGGEAAVRAAEAMLRLEPERVIFAHGAWFERDATASLRRSLSWLLPRP